MNFTYEALPGRVVFGPGMRHTIAEQAEVSGAARIMIVASRRDDGLVAEMCELLGERVVGRFDDIAQHVPVAQAEIARDVARSLAADTVITIGGGSATGFGKAIALEVDVSLIAVPTTYSGSEMTTIYGLTADGDKRTGRSPRVKPGIVVYDPELTADLPSRIAGPSGMNALAHCVEALYGPGANPFITAIALEGMAALHHSLPIVCARHDADADDDIGIAARDEALYGAYLAGVALASGGTALHHITCHVLGGMFGLNHGDMNAVVLGHALAYNAPAIPDLMERMAGALHVDDAASGCHDLAVAIGAPTSLASIGMPADGIADAARRVVDAAANNVRPPELAGITAMLRSAHAGDRPG